MRLCCHIAAFCDVTLLPRTNERPIPATILRSSSLCLLTMFSFKHELSFVFRRFIRPYAVFLACSCSLQTALFVKDRLDC